MVLEMFYDIFFYSTTMTKNHSAKKSFSEREDVINKALLRSIKRFYLQEFKKDNLFIVQQRYRQVSASTILNGFKTTCRRLFGDIPNLHKISQFLMIISGIKPMNKYPFSKRILKKGEHVSSAMYKYSSK